jgi:hypothetical protein
MNIKPSGGRGQWPTSHHLFVAALTAVTVVAGLATPWPWDLMPVAGLFTSLLLVARFGPWSPYPGHSRRGLVKGLLDELVLTGFVAGILFIVVSTLSITLFYGPPWLPAGADLALRLGVVALGVATVLAPNRARS